MKKWLSLVASLLCAGCMGVAEDTPDAGTSLTDSGVADAGLEVDAGDVTDAGTPDAGHDDDAGVPDAGLDAGVPDAGTTVDAGLRPIFVAIGKQRRRAISCDDGLTWTHDVTIDDAWPMDERYRCFDGTFTLPDGGSQSTDCDHNEWSSLGLVFGDGYFVHTMGWGAPGTVFRSSNGIDWQQVAMGVNATEVMFDEHRFVLATRSTRRSDDRGATWVDLNDIPVANGSNTIWNVRGGVAGGGVFVVTAQDGSNYDVQRSADRGETWQRPTMTNGGRLDACGAGRPVFGNGVFVTVRNDSGDTTVCRSDDGALTWSSVQLNGVSIESRLVWTGTEFIMWSPGGVHRSPDGITWTSQPTQTRRNGNLSGGPNIGAVARGPGGTFVATRGGWQVWYENQRFYRSTDGTIWDELPAGAFEPGHPITAMASGMVERSAACP